MTTFIRDKIIRKDYIILGSFYNLIISSKEPDEVLPCRNVLEIYHKNKEISYVSKPDGMFIMMNPGASRPSDSRYIPPKIRIENCTSEIVKNTLVNTIPDKAQCQVMRVMKEKKWEHVRVINLSDICSGNKDIFLNKLKIFEALINSDIHSIFSKERVQERSFAFNIGQDTPLVLAWGLDKRLIQLASKCMPYIQSFNIKGIPANLYFHASPQRQDYKEKWLNDIIKVL